MAQWGSVDFRELRELSNRMERLSRVDFDAFCREAARELAKRLYSKVIKRTQSGVVPASVSKEIIERYWKGYTGGSLKKAWEVLPIQFDGTAYTIEIRNNLEYASYVEYGHRQTPGQFIPPIGKCAVDAWVPGAFMLKISEDEVRQLSPALLERKLEKLLREVF